LKRQGIHWPQPNAALPVTNGFKHFTSGIQFEGDGQTTDDDADYETDDDRTDGGHRNDDDENAF